MKVLSKIKCLTLFIFVAIVSFALCVAFYVSTPVMAITSLEEVATFSLKGSSVRLVDPMGLQFTAEISNEEYLALKNLYGENVGFGMLISTDEHLENNNLTAPSFNGGLTSGENMMDIKNTVILDGENCKIYNAAITNIKEENYYKDFVCVGYISAQVEGDIIYKYTQPISAKYFSEVAESLTNTQITYTENQTETFNNVILSVVENSEKTVEFSFPQEETDLFAGDKIPITATFEGVDLPLNFETSDDSVVRIRNDKLIAVRAGSVNITASIGGKSKTETITISEDDKIEEYLLGSFVECDDNKVYAELERKPFEDSVKPHIVISGGSGLSDNRMININTNKSLTANTTYLLYMRVKAFANRAKSICIGYSFAMRTNFISSWTDLTTLSGFGANGLGDGNQDMYYSARYEMTPTSDVENLRLTIIIHASRFNSFNFEITDMYLVEKNVVDSDLLGGNKVSRGQTNFNGLNTEYYFSTNPKDVVTENSCGITFIKHKTTTDHVIYNVKLNKGIESGKQYTLKFKIIDCGVPTNQYNEYWFTYAGIKGLPDTYTTYPKAMQDYKTGGYMTKTTINGVTVFEFSITSIANESLDNAVFTIYLGSQKTQTCTFTDIQLIEQ